MDPDARKGRVADVALGRLHARGFASTTLEDVARAADLSEADVRALFGDKEGLLRELVSPLMERLRAVVVAAAAADRRRAGELGDVIGRYFDALLAHQRLVGVVMGDPTASSCPPVRLVQATVAGFRDTLAGGAGADLERTIRATAALGAVLAAVLELADVESATVRAVITDAAVAILLS